MKFGKYIKDNKIVVIIWIMFFVITFSIFSVFRIKFEAIVMYAALWLFAFIFSILWDFFRKKNYYDELINNTDGLDKKYFVSFQDRNNKEAQHLLITNYEVHEEK